MVKKSRPVVVWNNRASAYFKKAYEHIKEDPYSNAEKVREGITKLVDSLPDHPEKYSPDKYKKNNKGHYRAFEKYSYWVAYKYTEKEIRIYLGNCFFLRGISVCRSGSAASEPALGFQSSHF